MNPWILLCVMGCLVMSTHEQATTVQPKYSNITSADSHAVLDELYGAALKICLNKSLISSTNTIKSMEVVAENFKSKGKNLLIPLEILKSCLFTGSYDKEVAPYLITAHDIMYVSDYNYEFNYSITLNELLGINMGGSVTFTADFIFEWIDYRLRWKKSTVMEPWKFPPKLEVPTNKVWLPQLSVTNCQKRWCPVSPDNHTKVQIVSNGRVDMTFSDMLEASCQLDLLNFPFDEQTCVVNITYANLNDGDVNVKLNQLELGYSEYVNECDELLVITFNHEIVTTSGYTFTRDNTEVGKWNRQSRPGLNNTVMVTIKTIRVTTFYLTNLIIPMLVVIAITFATVIYPTGSEQKVNTLLTMILALVFFQSVLASVMPKTRDDPRLGKYVMWSMLFAGLDLFFTYATIIAMTIGERGHHLPSWARYFLAGYRFLFVRCCGLYNPKIRTPNAPAHDGEEGAGATVGQITTTNIAMIDSDEKEQAESEQAENKEQVEKNEKEWKRFAEVLNVVFNIIYAVLNIVIFVFYMVPLFTAYFVNARKTSYYKDN